MEQTHSLNAKIRLFTYILFPILITQLSLASAGFVDTVMAGNSSALDLAGVAVGVNIWQPVFTGLNGIIIGITPILAQYNGARNFTAVPFTVIQGLYLAAILSLIVLIAGFFLIPLIFAKMNFEPAVYRIGQGFLAAIGFGLWPLLTASVLRSFLDSLGYTRVTMLITLCTLPVNVILNYLLVFGKCGLPQMGGIGTGYASAITYWLLAIVFATVIHTVQPFKQLAVFKRWFRLSSAAIIEILKIGVPIGGAIFCEVSIFGVVALLMAKFGTTVIAAHQAAINFVSMIYMLPLSIGMALTITVGFEVGAARYDDARQYSRLGINVAVILSLIFALVLWLGKTHIANLYSNDHGVLALMHNFLMYAIFFQLSDAIAAPIQGILRGYKDVTATFVIALLSYWAIGLPVGYLLAEYTQWQAYGYWLGFIIGLAIGAVALVLRLRRIQQIK